MNPVVAVRFESDRRGKGNSMKSRRNLLIGATFVALCLWWVPDVRRDIVSVIGAWRPAPGVRTATADA